MSEDESKYLDDALDIVITVIIRPCFCINKLFGASVSQAAG